MTDPVPTSHSYPFLNGGGQLGGLIAAFDWSATSLGPMVSWPHWLRTTLATILRSDVPIVTLWGEDGVMLYNDAYSVFAGGRHPWLLGQRVREGWPEVADFNDNVMKVVLAGGTLAYADQELTLHRNGIPDQVWMNLDYSPVLDDEGRPAGVICIVVETSAKVKVERQQRNEQERLRTMFEQAPGFMTMLTGPDHVMTMCNQAYLDLVGGRDVAGKPVREALPEATAQGFIALLDEVYASGEPFKGTALPFSMTATGSASAREAHLDFVYQPLKDANGAVFGIFVQGADVSDRVQAENAVRASESTFRALAQSMPNQVWSGGVDGSLTWFNDTVYAYSGAAPGELDGDRWAGIVHPADVTAAAQAWMASVANGVTYETQFRIRRADGVFRWHIVRALPIVGADGAIMRWVGTNTDIEDQKSAADRLEHRAENLEIQVNQRTAERDRMWRFSTDIMLVVGLDGRIAAANPAFTRLLGWTEAEVLDTPMYALVHPADLDATLAEVASLAQGGNSFKFENRYRRKQGGYAILSWTAVPDLQYIHAVGRDMTAEREAAEAVLRSEMALQQSQKMEAIGKLTGGVAHDFNNLLQVISGNLQLLGGDVAGNTRAERRLDNALAGVTRGAKLASYLLAFGRRQALEPKVVKIGRYIVGMEDMLRRSLGEEIEVETVVSGGLWNTLVDTAQVENAVLNLCINARDAMDGMGKLTIEVGNASLDDAYASTNAEMLAGQYVLIAVSDTGSGMTPEVLAQAFDPFFSTKPEGKGSGLGLSMVYGFVKQSGGHVKIYSEPGSGTTVKLYLPRSFDIEDRAAMPEEQAVVGGQETILVAEDDDGVRATVVDLLTELGYRVLKANDAASALAVIDSGLPIDLLFTDVVMPGPLRSPELARKARERLPDIAVLFTSGYTENAIVHGGRLDAGVDLLGKPYTREALARKVRHVLANQQQRQQFFNAGTGQGQGQGQPGAPVTAKAAPEPASLRILLVEDEEDLRVTTAELLEVLGHAVVQAANGARALELLGDARFDVLITDISLPDISGEELAVRVRTARPALPVIFAAGQYPRAALENSSVLLKPFSMDKLLSALAGINS